MAAIKTCLFIGMVFGSKETQLSMSVKFKSTIKGIKQNTRL